MPDSESRTARGRVGIIDSVSALCRASRQSVTPYHRCQSLGSADRRRYDSGLGRGGGSDSSGRRRGLARGPARGGAGRAGMIRTLGGEVNARLGSLMLCVGWTRSRQASDSQTDTVLDNRPAAGPAQVDFTRNLHSTFMSVY